MAHDKLDNLVIIGQLSVSDEVADRVAKLTKGNND